MSEEGVESPRTGITGGCEPSCGFWELDQGPPQEQVLLTTGPSLEPLLYVSFMSAYGFSLFILKVIVLAGSAKRRVIDRFIRERLSLCWLLFAGTKKVTET